MTAQILADKLGEELVEKIESYQHSTKDSAFIGRWMKRLTYTSKKQSLAFWKYLVRDSQNLVIQLPEHQLSPFNFAQFVCSFFKSGSAQSFSKSFQIFCKRAISNNPSLLLNRYYVGNGGSPCYQLFSTYLFTKHVNGSEVDSCEQIEDSAFSIYKFIMENDYLSQQHCSSFFYGLSFRIHTSKYAFEVLQIFFQKYESFFLNADLQDNNIDYKYNTLRMIIPFFKDTLKRYSANYLDQYISSMDYRKVDQQQPYYQMVLRRNDLIKKFIAHFQSRHFLILQKYQNNLIKQAFKFINFQLLKKLVEMPGLKLLLFSQQYIFYLVTAIKVKQFSLLWSFEEERAAISKFKCSDKNILEVAAERRGLTHNLIDILWRSGLFQILPTIKNSKSRKIIHERYNISELHQNYSII